MNYKGLLFFIVSILICACSNDQTTKTNKKQDLIHPSTKEMVKELNIAHNGIDPSKVAYHLNSVRALNFEEKLLNETNFERKLNTTAMFAYETLLSGNTEKAIVEIEKLIATFNENNMGNRTYNLRQLLGLAYVRLGEQQNCIGQNNPESCIIPIRGNGVYKFKKGSETAISIYEGMLAEKPNDLETIWLLNIANMTIGTYPDGVPKKFRIDPKKFESEYKLPAFKNIANKTTIGTSGLAGGSAIEDFNNDGLLDVIASSWGAYDQLKVFLNNGNGNFNDVTEKSGLKGITGGLNIIHGDYNNDGYEDVFVLRGAWYKDVGQIPNSLLHNNGDGTFRDVTKEVGLFSKFPTQTATWVDVNRDGWLDLFIGNEATSNFKMPVELYINNKGKFENKTVEAGLQNVQTMIKGVCSGDIDNDRWPDIYLSVLGYNNILLKNNGVNVSGGVPTFSNIAASANVTQPIQSFPTWMWDYNNDGFLDILAAPFFIGTDKAANILASNLNEDPTNEAYPCLYMNNKNGSFTNTNKQMGLTEPVFAMGSNYGDLDNDGFLDFYLGSGTPSFAALVPNKMYRNNNGKSFQDVTYAGRFGHIQKGHGVSFGDFDNDGDQDIFHVLGGAYEGDIFQDVLFENPIGNENNWITIKLIGKTANKSAIGARLKLTCIDESGKEFSIHRVISTGGSFGSNCLQAEIGLNKATSVKTLTIIWPDMNSVPAEYKDLKINSFVEIEQGASAPNYKERKQFKF